MKFLGLIMTVLIATNAMAGNLSCSLDTPNGNFKLQEVPGSRETYLFENEEYIARVLYNTSNEALLDITSKKDHRHTLSRAAIFKNQDPTSTHLSLSSIDQNGRRSEILQLGCTYNYGH